MKRGGDLQSVVLACNSDGMEFLRKGNVKAAFEQLKYAEAVLLDRPDDSSCFGLLAITCNNLGCYYKRTGKLHAALSYLRRSLKIDVGMQTDDVAVGGTHLNLCAILSKLNKHSKALQHALCALELIGNRISLASSYGAAAKDDYATLAIAYHNVGVEREFLHQWEEAAMAYRQGREVGLRCLGETHPLVQALSKSCEAVLEKAARAAKHAPQHALSPGKRGDTGPVGARLGRGAADRPADLREEDSRPVSKAAEATRLPRIERGETRDAARDVEEEDEALPSRSAAGAWSRDLAGPAHRGRNPDSLDMGYGNAQTQLDDGGVGPGSYGAGYPAEDAGAYEEEEEEALSPRQETAQPYIAPPQYSAAQAQSGGALFSAPSMVGQFGAQSSAPQMASPQFSAPQAQFNTPQAQLSAPQTQFTTAPYAQFSGADAPYEAGGRGPGLYTDGGVFAAAPDHPAYEEEEDPAMVPIGYGDIVQILKEGGQHGNEGVVTEIGTNACVMMSKDLMVITATGTKRGKTAGFLKNEVLRTGRTMTPEQIAALSGPGAAAASGEGGKGMAASFAPPAELPTSFAPSSGMPSYAPPADYPPLVVEDRRSRAPRSEAFARPPPARVDGAMPQPNSVKLDDRGLGGLEPPPLVLDNVAAPDGPRPPRSRPHGRALVTSPLPPTTGAAKPLSLPSDGPPAPLSGLAAERRRGTAGRGPKKAVVEKRAAEKIQRCWRREKEGMKFRRQRRKVETAAATKIQSRYRSFRVVRRKKNLAAATIQRYGRGCIVRRQLRRRKSVLILQRWTRGVLIRKEIHRLHLYAMRMQANMRGHLGRKEGAKRHNEYTKAATTTQRAYRGHQARKEARRRRSAKQEEDEKHRQALKIQSIARGRKDREKTKAERSDRMKNRAASQAAMRIQCAFRRKVASAKVAALRREAQARKDNAATVIQKNIRRYLFKRKYQRLVGELASKPASVVTLQRFARGFLVRKHLYEGARRAEQELWATGQIQRMWRGYRGRLAWEAKYEESWSREVASLRIQRAYRGFRARVRVLGVRKRFLRAEFAVAKRVFASAQQIQSHARGRAARRGFAARKAAVLTAIVTIQRIWRGHSVRGQLWRMVLHERATCIQSHARGLVVRARLAVLQYYARMIQRSMRICVARKRRKRRLRQREAQGEPTPAATVEGLAPAADT